MWHCQREMAQGFTSIEVLGAVRMGQLRPTVPADTDKWMASVMQRCWAQDPATRCASLQPRVVPAHAQEPCPLRCSLLPLPVPQAQSPLSALSHSPPGFDSLLPQTVVRGPGQRGGGHGVCSHSSHERSRALQAASRQVRGRPPRCLSFPRHPPAHGRPAGPASLTPPHTSTSIYR